MLPKARVFAAVGVSAMLLWPASASAQRAHAAPAQGHAVAAPAQGTAVVRGGVYGPYYRPYYYPYYYRPFYPFYSPFYFGFGLYYNSFWGWYPYYAGFPFPPYPYAYPYPPYYYSGGWASARIEVKPKEAEVYVDGYYVGVVDQFDGIFQRLDIPPGQRDLVIYMPGYHTLHERMAFAPGQSYHFKETLQPLAAGEPQDPKPQPDPNAAPPNAPAPPNTPAPSNAPAPYPNAPAPYPNAPQAPPPPQGPYRQPPPPPQGEPRMEPYPPAPQNRGGEFGTLNLRVQPEDAIVSIDGEHWDNPQGGSRLTVQLAPGTHRIEVKKEGFHTYTGTVEIRPGEPQTLNISLPRELFELF